MYQYEFFDVDRYQRFCDEHGSAKRGEDERVPEHFVKPGDIELVRSSFWAAHCLNCGEPKCFGECPLFVPRADQRCVRLSFGMKDAAEFPEFIYHCELAFKRWSKIETGFFPGAYSMAEADQRERYWRGECAKQWLAMNAGALSETICPVEQRKRFWNEKSWDAAHAGTVDEREPDIFLLQLYSYEREPFRMLYEITVDKAKRVIYRKAFPVKPGFNQFCIDVGKFIASDERKWVRIYPYQNQTGHVVLLFCEHVRLADGARKRLTAAAEIPDACTMPAFRHSPAYMARASYV